MIVIAIISPKQLHNSKAVVNKFILFRLYRDSEIKLRLKIETESYRVYDFYHNYMMNRKGNGTKGIKTKCC